MHVYNLNPADFTPVIGQYLAERQKLTGKSVLLFRMGDFYEAFFDDAELLARELEITLTARPENNYPGGRLPMAGVPAKAVKPYIQKLLEKNYKVYVAEQMADPKTCKGLVPREIAKVYTPGTINELEFLESYRNNFILAIYADKKQENFGLAYTDISTGEFYVSEIKEKFLTQELARIQAAEVLIPAKKAKKQSGQIAAEEELLFDINCKNISAYAKENFDLDLARQNISSVFEIKSVDALIKDSLEGCQGLALIAAGAIIEYLKETHAIDFADKISKSFDVIKTYNVSEYMLLDAVTRNNLELSKTLAGASQGSFFSVIDRSASKPGRRRLAAWLEQPLYDLAHIQARQDAVEELFQDASLSMQLHELLQQSYDIDRLSSRLASGLISPRELNSLKRSLEIVLEISLLLQSVQSGLITSLKAIPQAVPDFIRQVEDAVVMDPPLNITEGSVINPHYHAELQEIVSLVEDSQAWLNNFQEQERSKLDIKNLKVAFNKVHGYFIETSRINQAKLPENYIIKQTMVNTVRAITSELKDFEEKITNSEARRNALEYKLYDDLRKKLAQDAALIKQIGMHMAELDALLSMSLLAREKNYTRPVLDKSQDLVINDARHPVVEAGLKLGQFVPNDICLEATEAPIMLLTGPNMAGKSTFMRQNALIILLAQIGSFVPASSARIGLCDRIFTRIGASDDIATGRSTFMVEMEEVATILNGASPRSFVILDEIGRGTSTYDGVAIAWSILEFLAKEIKPRVVFATHYHELAGLEHVFSCIKNYQVLVSEENGSIGFLHKVVEGSADRSYGIEVAKLAGLPNSVLQRARAINNQLQANKSKKLGFSKKQIDQQGVKDAISDDGSLEIDKLPLFQN